MIKEYLSDEELEDLNDLELEDLIFNGMNNLRTLLLKKNKHIKEYLKYRDLHSKILNSMANYIFSDKFDLSIGLNNISNEILKETKNNYDLLSIGFDLNKNPDINLYVDISIYKNHPNMKCVIEQYIEKNKFKNEEKVKMLNAMNNSILSFFRVLKKEQDGFVEIKDVVTGSTYKVIDLALSNPLYNNTNTYFYSRLITMNDISFLSCLMALPTNNKKINNYIKECRHRRKSKLVQTLEVYKLNKEYGYELKLNEIK